MNSRSFSFFKMLNTFKNERRCPVMNARRPFRNKLLTKVTAIHNEMHFKYCIFLVPYSRYAISNYVQMAWPWKKMQTWGYIRKTIPVQERYRLEWNWNQWFSADSEHVADKSQSSYPSCPSYRGIRRTPAFASHSGQIKHCNSSA